MRYILFTFLFVLFTFLFYLFVCLCATNSTGQIEYLSFINQASLTRKNLFLDQRYAAECGVCERCTGRKGRCARCLAIRVGGGYIILDGSELPEERRASRNSCKP